MPEIKLIKTHINPETNEKTEYFGIDEDHIIQERTTKIPKEEIIWE